MQREVETQRNPWISLVGVMTYLQWLGYLESSSGLSPQSGPPSLHCEQFNTGMDFHFCLPFGCAKDNRRWTHIRQLPQQHWDRAFQHSLACESKSYQVTLSSLWFLNEMMRAILKCYVYWQLSQRVRKLVEVYSDV